VLQTLLFNITANPVQALLDGNFIGILAWAIGLGFASVMRRKAPGI